jgi:uncharacterized protein (UPF0264 family)
VHWVVDRNPGSLGIGDGMDDMHGAHRAEFVVDAHRQGMYVALQGLCSWHVMAWMARPHGIDTHGVCSMPCKNTARSLSFTALHPVA